MPKWSRKWIEKRDCKSLLRSMTDLNSSLILQIEIIFPAHHDLFM